MKHAFLAVLAALSLSAPPALARDVSPGRGHCKPSVAEKFENEIDYEQGKLDQFENDLHFRALAHGVTDVFFPEGKIALKAIKKCFSKYDENEIKKLKDEFD